MNRLRRSHDPVGNSEPPRDFAESLAGRLCEAARALAPKHLNETMIRDGKLE